MHVSEQFDLLQSEERQVGHRYLCHLSTEMAEIWSLDTFIKMFGHTKFQLSVSCTFIVMKRLVEITKYITKSLVTLKV